MGIKPLVVGLTAVVFGTSLPELATIVLSAIRRDVNISAGNIIGSNLFIILTVLGVIVVMYPLELSRDAYRRLGDAGSVSGALAHAVFGQRIHRLEGGTMVIFYAGYVIWFFTQQIGSMSWWRVDFLEMRG